MTQLIRAVYEAGRFRPLEPVDLIEGQEVNIAVSSDKDLVRFALGDLVSPSEPFVFVDEVDVSDESLLEEIQRGFAGTRPLSEIIIEERL